MRRWRQIDARVPWFVPALLAIVLALGLGTGFALALSGRMGQAVAPPSAHGRRAPLATDGLRLVALGDSITDGVGDVEGGHVARLVSALRDAGLTVDADNLAESGSDTRDLLETLGRARVQEAVAAADVIVLSIGGNDFVHAERGRSEDADLTADEARAATAERLAEALTLVRRSNPGAPVRLVGLYNPFEVDEGAMRLARRELAAWNRVLEEATFAHEDVIVVPIADAFFEQPGRLAADRFHPGPMGHEVIADRVRSALPMGAQDR